MMKERIAAIFIGLIMLMSVVGFAGLYPSNLVNQNSQNEINIQLINYRELDSQEKSLVLQAGRVLIENFYSSDCQECLERNTVLINFANRYGNNLILEMVEGSVDGLKIVGREGDVIEIDTTIKLTEDDSSAEFL